ncbi:hypothetical protein Tco_0843574 [Tanacetum coccineum]|uniref:Uncharacterized protein n=1 Tax=Tanacetum coccineum TaxID=301880 RepID=A0ABQ5B597_9ASTR
METEVESMVTVPIQQVSSSVPLLILQSSISHLLNQYLLPVKNHSLQLSPPTSALQQSSSVLEMVKSRLLTRANLSFSNTIYPVAIVASRAVDPVGSPSSTTIDQDEQSTSTSPTNQEIQSQVTHQGPVPQFMAPDHSSSGPVLHEMMSDHNSSVLAPQRQEMSVENVSSGLVPQGQKASDYDNSDPVPPRQNVVPTAEKTDSSQQGLEFLFSPLLEEYYNPTHGQAEENNNNQAPNASFQEDEFINPFCTPSHEYQWTKDHPLEQVIDNPTNPVQTRQQLATDPEMCMFALTVYVAQPDRVHDPDHPEIVCKNTFLGKFVGVKASSMSLSVSVFLGMLLSVWVEEVTADQGALFCHYPGGSFLGETVTGVAPSLALKIICSFPTTNEIFPLNTSILAIFRRLIIAGCLDTLEKALWRCASVAGSVRMVDISLVLSEIVDEDTTSRFNGNNYTQNSVVLRLSVSHANIMQHRLLHFSYKAHPFSGSVFVSCQTDWDVMFDSSRLEILGQTYCLILSSTSSFILTATRLFNLRKRMSSKRSCSEQGTSSIFFNANCQEAMTTQKGLLIQGEAKYTSKGEHLKMEMEIPCSNKIKFITACSFLNDTFKYIMKAQVYVFKASATLNIQAFKIKKSVSISFRMTQVHKTAKDYMMMIRDYDWMMISKKLKDHIQVKLKPKSLKFTASDSQDTDQ